MASSTTPVPKRWASLVAPRCCHRHLTLGTVEQAFNSIFNVSPGRTWAAKFSDYISVISQAALIVAAVRCDPICWNCCRHVPGVGLGGCDLDDLDQLLFPLVFFPNTRVCLRAAASVVGSGNSAPGQSMGYGSFPGRSVRYPAIYVVWAAVPILADVDLISRGAIVLLGAELTAVRDGIDPTFDSTIAPGLHSHRGAGDSSFARLYACSSARARAMHRAWHRNELRVRYRKSDSIRPGPPLFRRRGVDSPRDIDPNVSRLGTAANHRNRVVTHAPTGNERIPID